MKEPRTGASGAPTVGDMLTRNTRGRIESDRQHAFHEKIEADRRKRATLYFNYPGPWEFLFSEAGRAITKTHPSALVVYLHVIARQPLPPKKKERMRLEKLGLWPPKKPKEFSFPIEEGPIHGLGKSATASGLRILHDVGAIDRLTPGSATRGEFATYVVSDRWRQWRPPAGGPDFMVVEWMKAQVIGTRDSTIKDEDGNVIHKGTGMFLKRKTPKTSRKVRVVESTTTSKPSLVAMKTTREKPLVVMNTMNKAPDADPPVAMSTIFLSLPVLGSDLKEVKTGRKSNSAPKRNTLHPITDDPQAIADLAAALSSIVGRPPCTDRAKRKPGRPRRNLDPTTAPILDRGYDPDLGPWAEDEAMTVSLGRGGTVH